MGRFLLAIAMVLGVTGFSSISTANANATPKESQFFCTGTCVAVATNQNGSCMKQINSFPITTVTIASASDTVLQKLCTDSPRLKFIARRIIGQKYLIPNDHSSCSIENEKSKSLEWQVDHFRAQIDLRTVHCFQSPAELARFLLILDLHGID